MKIRNVSYSQVEILQNIVKLHTGPIECDVTYGSGVFYKAIPRPPLCLDRYPRESGIITADVCQLPIKNCQLRSIMFDPPFMARTGPGSIMKSRFKELVGTAQDLLRFYFLAMKEIHRVLLPGGWLVFKCQDGVLSGVNNLFHIDICIGARSLGFQDIDLFHLIVTNRMDHPDHDKQIHARKFNSYFFVFRKRGKLVERNKPIVIKQKKGIIY